MNPNPLRSSLAFLLLTLAIVQPSLSSLAVPGLHIERVKIGTTTSPTPYTYSAAGHDFSHTWRTTLPAVLQVGMALNEFQVEAHSYLSYEVAFPAKNTTGMTYNIKPTYSGVKIDYMSFSVIVITENNQLVELVEEMATAPLNSGYYSLGCSKYDLTAHGIKYMLMYESLVCVELASSRTVYTTITNIFVNPSNSSELQFSFSLYQAYLVSAKILFIVVNSTSKQFYKSQDFSIETTLNKPVFFQINFGIDTSFFGEPAVSETCLFGISYINFIYHQTDPGLVIFLYNYTGNQIITFTGSSVMNKISTNALCIQLIPSANQTPSSSSSPSSQNHDTLIIGVAAIIQIVVIVIFVVIIVVIKKKTFAAVHAAKEELSTKRPSQSKMKDDVEFVEREPYSQAETSSNRIDNPSARFKKAPSVSSSGIQIVERFR